MFRNPVFLALCLVSSCFCAIETTWQRNFDKGNGLFSLDDFTSSNMAQQNFFIPLYQNDSASAGPYLVEITPNGTFAAEFALPASPNPTVASYDAKTNLYIVYENVQAQNSFNVYGITRTGEIVWQNTIASTCAVLFPGLLIVGEMISNNVTQLTAFELSDGDSVAWKIQYDSDGTYCRPGIGFPILANAACILFESSSPINRYVCFDVDNGEQELYFDIGQFDELHVAADQQTYLISSRQNVTAYEAGSAGVPIWIHEYPAPIDNNDPFGPAISATSDSFCFVGIYNMTCLDIKTGNLRWSTAYNYSGIFVGDDARVGQWIPSQDGSVFYVSVMINVNDQRLLIVDATAGEITSQYQYTFFYGNGTEEPFPNVYLYPSVTANQLFVVSFEYSANDWWKTPFTLDSIGYIYVDL